MAKTQTMDKLLVDELRDLLDAEKQITRVLPKMAKAVDDEEIRTAFEEHLAMTEQQIERLNQAFDQLGQPARGKRCTGMAGIIEEGQELISELDEPAVLEAALIGAAQKVEHYEIAAYGTAVAFARQLGHQEIVQLLEQTLEEEKQTDQRLTGIAENRVNEQASEAGGWDMARSDEEPGAGTDRGQQRGAAGASSGRRAGAARGVRRNILDRSGSRRSTASNRASSRGGGNSRKR